MRRSRIDSSRVVVVGVIAGLLDMTSRLEKACADGDIDDDLGGVRGASLGMEMGR